MATRDDVDIHSEEFLRSLLRKQFRLSAGFAGVFLAALFGLPLANYFFPDLMATRVFGFTLTWLILGVAFYPLVWMLSWMFIRRSIRMEEAVARQVQSRETVEERTVETPGGYAVPVSSRPNAPFSP